MTLLMMTMVMMMWTILTFEYNKLEKYINDSLKSSVQFKELTSTRTNEEQ